MGVELYRSGQFEDALHQVQQFLENPGNTMFVMQSEAHKVRLMALMQMQRPDVLLYYSAESIRLFPDYTDLYHFHGYAWKMVGRPEEALQSLQQALRLGPAAEDYASLRGLGSFLTCMDIGDVYDGTGELYNGDLYYTLASLRSERLAISLSTMPD